VKKYSLAISLIILQSQYTGLRFKKYDTNFHNFKKHFSILLTLLMPQPAPQIMTNYLLTLNQMFELTFVRGAEGVPHLKHNVQDPDADETWLLWPEIRSITDPNDLDKLNLCCGIYKEDFGRWKQAQALQAAKGAAKAAVPADVAAPAPVDAAKEATAPENEAILEDVGDFGDDVSHLDPYADATTEDDAGDGQQGDANKLQQGSQPTIRASLSASSSSSSSSSVASSSFSSFISSGGKRKKKKGRPLGASNFKLPEPDKKTVDTLVSKAGHFLCESWDNAISGFGPFPWGREKGALFLCDVPFLEVGWYQLDKVRSMLLATDRWALPHAAFLIFGWFPQLAPLYVELKKQGKSAFQGMVPFLSGIDGNYVLSTTYTFCMFEIDQLE
jgi:hypothetical protein